MSSDTLYEHPLNEQVRVYLRLEHLLNQLDQAGEMLSPHDAYVFFKSLFDLMEILEQVQIKGDLAKDLDKLKIKLENWAGVPGVDRERLDILITRTAQLQQSLLQSPRLGQSLKADKFLSGIRQRFNIPGGTCSFDLPILHHWQSLPLVQRQSDTQRWQDSLRSLKNALGLWLSITRESVGPISSNVRNGFFQQDIENASLLRIFISPEHQCYPLISAHKSRFAMRFMPFDETVEVAENMALKIAIC
ncbi:cell division protein ZapD [Veronia nyctiphanis]|uniref:Cell division protein ZapD n=1 Tax=Veronia nyctiphanis TaxID=1278244 RepID=A0A4Q0YNF4_9GAMM|nr:cell division protein ZapD [Veronia nyctiphanis]RXJ72472.1 cell division protein ZapD [Veronia nyctiphanis]